MQFDLEQRNRRGFTLMELLLVMAIMAVLTTMSLALIRKTNEDANVSATQARILKIESILQTELERFETRRLPISKAVIDQYVQQNPSRNVPPAVQARNLRQRIMMDILNCEWPQANLSMNAQGEVTYTQRTNLGSFPSNDAPADSRTDPFVAWLNQNYPNPQPLSLALMSANLRSGTMANWQNWSGASPQNISGEYLYEILRQIDYDGMPAIETLGNAIVDSDGDGKLEIVDAWGEPLAMILVQVKANEIQPEVFEDQIVESTKFADATSIVSVGIELLNPAAAPREMQHIRVKVISARLGLRNSWLD